MEEDYVMIPGSGTKKMLPSIYTIFWLSTTITFLLKITIFSYRT